MDEGFLTSWASKSQMVPPSNSIVVVRPELLSSCVGQKQTLRPCGSAKWITSACTRATSSAFNGRDQAVRGLESSTGRPPRTARCNNNSVINANHRRVMGIGVTDDLLGRHHCSHRASNTGSGGDTRAQGNSNDHREVVVVGGGLEQGGTATGGRVQVGKEA